VGKVVYISSEDVSEDSSNLVLGYMTIDVSDSVKDISAILDVSYVDASGDITSQSSTIDLY
jgi:hypothetical protein